MPLRTTVRTIVDIPKQEEPKTIDEGLRRIHESYIGVMDTPENRLKLGMEKEYFINNWRDKHER